MKSISDIYSQFLGENARSSLIKKNIIASFAIKGWSVLVQLMLVPLTLACLGVYENGIWLTISSVLLWIDHLDIGLGNGLRNKLAIYIAREDIAKAREMVSSTLAMLTVIIVPVAILLIAAELMADNYQVFNVEAAQVDQLDAILIVTTLLVCTTFIFKFIGNFYLGLQLPAINNLLVTCGNTIALLGTFLIYLSGRHSMLLVALAYTMAPLLTYLTCYPITFWGKYRNLRPSWRFVKASAIKELFSVGINFFILQIAGVILFFSSNIIIARLFSPSMVTPYQIAHRYFMVPMMIFTIVCVPYWSATTDAYERKDYEWIKHANRTLNRFILATFVLIIAMILFSDMVYGLWIRHQAEVPFAITVIVGLYQFLLIWSTRYSFILNGIGALRLQLIMTIIAAVIYIPLAVLVGRTTQDINYLLLVMCGVNTPGLIVNAIQYHKLISGHATGIWKK